MHWRGIDSSDLPCRTKKPVWDLNVFQTELWFVMGHFGSLWLIMGHLGSFRVLVQPYFKQIMGIFIIKNPKVI